VHSKSHLYVTTAKVTNTTWQSPCTVTVTVRHYYTNVCHCITIQIFHKLLHHTRWWISGVIVSDYFTRSFHFLLGSGCKRCHSSISLIIYPTNKLASTCYLLPHYQTWIYFVHFITIFCDVPSFPCRLISYTCYEWNVCCWLFHIMLAIECWSTMGHLMFIEVNHVWFILRPFQHNNGYIYTSITDLSSHRRTIFFTDVLW